jgi:hypothetical protein
LKFKTNLEEFVGMARKGRNPYWKKLEENLLGEE